jgi:hypothetical protein
MTFLPSYDFLVSIQIGSFTTIRGDVLSIETTTVESKFTRGDVGISGRKSSDSLPLQFDLRYLYFL